jgi:hypothetical protein
MQRILTLDEVAEILKRSRRHVLDLCKRGELEFKPGDRYHKFIKESDFRKIPQ